MIEQEYVTIEVTIRKVPLGTEKSDRLISRSSNISEEFKNELWCVYSVDIDNMPLTPNCEILERLKSSGYGDCLTGRNE